MIKELFILPFDHRSSFIKDILELKGKPNENQKRVISELKETIFEGFLDYAKNKKNFGILIDEEYGKNIIKRAKKEKVILCVSTEKSGKQEFEFEYKDFGKHIKKTNPDYVKLLVKYDITKNNQKQLNKFKQLNDFCKKNHYKILFELLAQDDVKSIEEIKKYIKPNIWKLEGDNDWKKVIKVINKNSQIIMLGRGENEKMVENWIKKAKPFKEIIGFAIGRTIFLKTIKKYFQKKISREKAIKQISNNFKHFAQIWKN